MVVFIVIISVVFILIGFYLNESNIQNRLNGFNLNSKKEQQKYDLKKLAWFVKKFSWFLGVSLLIIGLSLTVFFEEKTMTLFLCFYSVVGVVIMMAIVNGNRFKKKAP